MWRAQERPHRALDSPIAAATWSAALRVLSLVGKFALTLYMARVFSLDALGRYGLAFAAVMFAMTAFGFKLDYVVAREILGFDPRTSQRICKTVTVLYLASFVIAAPLTLFAIWLFEDGRRDTSFAIIVYLLCCAEAYAQFLHSATVALKRPVLANALFLIRSGGWTLPAIGFGLVFPAMRDVSFVLLCWLMGTLGCVALNLWYVRDRFIGSIGDLDMRWGDVFAFLRRTALIWFGSMALTLGMWADRFVLASVLNLDEVGIATFYTSFTAAVLYLVQSATTTVRFPLMIEHYDARRRLNFRREFGATARAALMMSGAILVVLAAAMAPIARAMGKPQLVEAYPIFLLVLAATWIRVHAETLYYALFITRRDHAIWTGNVFFLVSSVGANYVLVRLFGLPGFGIAAIISAAAILGWRAYHARDVARAVWQR